LRRRPIPREVRRWFGTIAMMGAAMFIVLFVTAQPEMGERPRHPHPPAGIARAHNSGVDATASM